MPRRRKSKRKTGEDELAEGAAPKPAPAVGTSIGSLLQGAGLDKLAAKRAGGSAQQRAGAALPSAKPKPPAQPKPSAAPVPPAPDQPLGSRELSLLHRAYQGVEPIARPKHSRVRRPSDRPAAARESSAADEAARARLSQLVGGGVHFDVTWDDGLVQGLRKRGEPKLLARLSGSAFGPEAQLDLHGLRRAEVERAVSQFVRAQHRRGVRYLLVIPGKGQHSDDGVGVLGQALADALTEGAAAPLVLAFASAHARHGGRGAVAVMLA